MIKLGTQYGGWFIPNNISLDGNSIIYSAGVGEDISFDLMLQDKYNCNILLIDPTERSIIHYNEIFSFYNNKDILNPFTGNIQKDYYSIISLLNPNLSKIKYIDCGLWNSRAQLKFYKQSNESYISQSLIENMFSNNYDIVNVDTLKNIMHKNNHNYIDFLKLDIEGAEINVLNNMLDDNIFPKYLCVEFDLLLKNKDYNNLTKQCISRLINNGYKILYNDNYNITFQHNKYKVVK
jgi:FkbM family methyltransferase